MTDMTLTDQEKQQYDPKTYLLDQAQPTGIPLVYQNREPVLDPALPLVVIVFGPGGVGKDTVTQPLYSEGLVYKVQTATSRPRRVHEGESEEYYLWMRQPQEDESRESYVANLAREYELLEHIDFNGFVYGVPMSNLEKTLKIGIPMLVITTAGVEHVRQALQSKANVVSIFVVPESYDQLFTRVSKRENPEQRLRISFEEIRIAPTLANYYLYNPVEIDGQQGLPKVQDSLKKLLLQLKQSL